MWEEERDADAMRSVAKLVMERGYEGAHAEALAQALRMSVGQLYRVHGDKRELLRKVRAFGQVTLTRLMRYSWGFLWEDDLDFGAAFAGLWCELAQRALAQPSLFGVAFLLVPPEDDPAPAVCELRQWLVGVLEEAVARGVVRPMPPPALLALAWGPLAELARGARLSPGPPTEAEIEALAAAVWAGLRAVPTAGLPAKG